MAICPKCHTPGEDLFAPCPSGDGYYCIDEKDAASYPDDTVLGRKVAGRFLIVSVIGKGAMGYVYKARQDQVDRLVALKIFRPEAFAHGQGARSVQNIRDAAQQRFVQEAKVLGRLAHPNCVTLYDFGVSEEEDFLYIAMEYVGGISLRRAVRRGVKLDALIDIVGQILLALREAHSLGIVHRDLKPENIMVSVRQTSQEQVIKVLDFGIAKLLEGGGAKTTAGLLFGTPAYMSPEQCRGDLTIGAPADIYALGCLVFELITGGLPYQATTPQEMVRMHQEEPIPVMVPRDKLEISKELQAFVRRCLAKDPAERYGDGKSALGAFEEATASGTNGGGGRQKPGRTGHGTGRKRVVVPRDKVSGVALNPLAKAEGVVVADEEGKLKAPRVQQVSRSLGDVCVDELKSVETLIGEEFEAGGPGSIEGGRSSGALLAVGALGAAATLCVLLFYYLYRVTLG